MHKAKFYIPAIFQHLFVPAFLYRLKTWENLNKISNSDICDIAKRVNHYNKLNEPFELPKNACRLADMNFWSRSACYYDTRKVVRHFPKNMQYLYDFRDIVHSPEDATVVKSRPMIENNVNSVLLKLNSVRNFQKINDKRSFSEKIPKLVWRGQVNRTWRKEFVEKYWNHKHCNVGHVNHQTNLLPFECSKPYMSIKEQLEYKYILSLEGNNYATNLKWIAQSNSLCFMPKPKHETWFMESKLLPDVHFVEIKDDYSDLSEKIDFYNLAPQRAEKIINNFNFHYRQCINCKTDHVISLLIMAKYFHYSEQFDLREFLDERMWQSII